MENDQMDIDNMRQSIESENISDVTKAELKIRM